MKGYYLEYTLNSIILIPLSLLACSKVYDIYPSVSTIQSAILVPLLHHGPWTATSSSNSKKICNAHAN